METTLNLALFTRLNAAPDSDPRLLLLAEVFAVYLIWMVPALLVIGWLRGSDRLKRPLLEAFVATLLALAASWLLGFLWPSPRPFMVPVGQTFLEHAPTPGFPSNHATIMLTMAFSLLLHAGTRRIGRYLLLLALPVAWARIFLGVHFPQDMLGALLLAAVTATLVGASRTWLILPFYHHVAMRLYRLLFAPLIRRGWVAR
ncbi:phosphatase PAP2 family protein [Halomonas sp. MCCC 1A17488]|uniref:undecaprenyl-diphosphate phosphatase n=2 Tax=Halomonadaceae TaxID=28256 RepID=A0ABX7WBF8_9GAMM|nr:phosphatase PAP2 family protein [Halomonas sp. MCCC 1A17488]MCG3240634.1 phosphatase PAP2 family protein [Halomonas sp. MCCC 1A17488]QPP51735.1 phosphatase PAP2 family protein [Halomonas sp. SS10-MC5]QTP57225.1 phosphatase PAP2 family protein [Halomonas sulfidoxydans]